MGQQFDRVAIALSAGGTEYVVLETQLIQDFGHGQGPRGGVMQVQDGWVVVRGTGEARLQAGEVAPGGNFPPRLTLLDAQGVKAVEIAAHEDPTGQPHLAKIYIEGNSATIRFRDAKGNDHALLDGAGGNLYLGGLAADGDIVLFAVGQADNRNVNKATVHLDGAAGSLALGGAGRDGQLFFFHPAATTETALTATAQLTGHDGYLRLGGNGGNAQVLLFDADNKSDIRDASAARIHLDAKSGKLSLRRAVTSSPDEFIPAMKDMVVLDASTGDIVLANADCAEDFEVTDFDAATPGAVMVLDDAGRLCRCTEAYDRKVAGIVSGAGALKPGIVLGRDGVAGRSRPIALAGRVNCQVDARYGPVEVGSLLTTSSTPGHAMRAVDERRAFGAVIGKALAPLAAGQALVPILVALQ